MKKHTISRRNFINRSAKASIAFTIIPRFVLGGKNFTAPSDKLTTGFIGTGKQARGLMKSFAAKTQVVAGADVDSKKLDLFKSMTEKAYAEANDQSSWKGFSAYGDLRELIARKDIDAVIVATPDHWHALATIMAADAKKHVYCEKPLAHSVEEGRMMVEAVKRNNIILQTGSMQRSRKNFRVACELVRNGYVGDIKEVLVSVGQGAVPCYLPPQQVPAELNWDMWVGPAPFHAFNAELSPPVEKDIFPNWRNYKEYGGGMVSDWGAHMFDIAQWALDKDRSGPVTFIPPNGNDIKSLTMIYDNGIVMKHEDFGRGNAVRFIGTKGMLDISREFLDSNPATIATATISASETHLYQSDDHHIDWIDSIQKNKQPICDVETGHRTSSLCCVANITYWLNQKLEWDPVKEKFRGNKHADKLLKATSRNEWKYS